MFGMRRSSSKLARRPSAWPLFVAIAALVATSAPRPAIVASNEAAHTAARARRVRIDVVASESAVEESSGGLTLILTVHAQIAEPEGPAQAVPATPATAPPARETELEAETEEGAGTATATLATAPEAETEAEPEAERASTEEGAETEEGAATATATLATAPETETAPPPVPQLRLVSTQGSPVPIALEAVDERSWRAEVRIDLRPVCGEDDACTATFFVEPTGDSPVPVWLSVTARAEAVDVTTSMPISNPAFSSDATLSVQVSDGG